ncbi:MAG: hypothetical protein R2864_07580 [Syntrophotaleaceae bacterium]
MAELQLRHAVFTAVTRDDLGHRRRGPHRRCGGCGASGGAGLPH